MLWLERNCNFFISIFFFLIFYSFVFVFFFLFSRSTDLHACDGFDRTWSKQAGKYTKGVAKRKFCKKNINKGDALEKRKFKQKMHSSVVERKHKVMVSEK